ncbi:MAG TPA: hypothetical protein VFE42_20495 [Chloroflexota bacterium]|nr:hypothetical protein [Chloroflexota bacterium]
MIRFATLVVAAAAIVLACSSGDLLLSVAAICGACGIVALLNMPSGIMDSR